MEGRHRDRATAELRIFLLGGFRVERASGEVPATAWRRRSARTVVKILAATASHRLHREELQELLFPEADADTAYVHLRQALFAARRALQPGLLANVPSAYLAVTHDVVSLIEDRVWVDIDDFEHLAQLGLTDDAAQARLQHLRAALAAYGGEMLPEDRLEEWSTARRDALATLHTRLLLASADCLEAGGLTADAIAPLRQVLAADPAREEIHRRIMRLFAFGGSRHAALQQYRACQAALRELDAEPDAETMALCDAILHDRLPRPTTLALTGSGDDTARSPTALPAILQSPSSLPLVGRGRALNILREELEHAAGGNRQVVFIGGEAGVGKTRLAAEAARDAWEAGAAVLWGTAYAREGLVPYGPLVMALDGYLTNRPPTEREGLAREFLELAGLVPALQVHDPAVAAARPGHLDVSPTRLFAALLRLLTTLAADRSLVLVLDDLHAADPGTLQAINHVAHQYSVGGHRRPLLIIATYRDDELDLGGELQRLIDSLARHGLCRTVDLLRLAREDSNSMVKSLLAHVEPENARIPDVDEALLTHVYALSLGNPLFLAELVRSLQERDEIVLHDGMWMFVQRSTCRHKLGTETPELRTQNSYQCATACQEPHRDAAAAHR